jgi:hypothetical protein
VASTIYILFGIIAGIGFGVAALRWASLRQYKSLLDPLDPRTARDGTVLGSYSGRSAQVGLVTPDSGSHVPPKVQASITCDVPLRIEARRRSLATSLRKAVGVLSERTIDSRDLEKRYMFQFDDRAKMKASLARIEVQQSFQALADCGADLVLLTNGHLTVEVPMTYYIPIPKGRVAEVLTAMHTLASGIESALSVPSPGRSWTRETGQAPDASEPAPENLWPASATRGAEISGMARMGVTFVGLAIAYLVLGSFWDFNGHIPWQVRFATVQDRLPAVAVLAGAATFFASFLVPRRPLLWGLLVSWPLVIHAILVLVLYVVLRVSSIPEIQQALGRELQLIPSGLRIAAWAAAVGLGSGLFGAILGSRVGASRRDLS